VQPLKNDVIQIEGWTLSPQKPSIGSYHVSSRHHNLN